MTNAAANTNHWKGDITDLRSCAEAVMTSPATASAPMSARNAARVLHGVMSHISRRWSVDEMQRACAELVRHNDAWVSNFTYLPHEPGEAASEPVQLVAVVCRGLTGITSPSDLRAALSFWATETDRSVWAELVRG